MRLAQIGVGTVALLFALLALPGCNSGLGVLLYLLLEDDDDDDDGGGSTAVGTAVLEFIGIDNARSAPQETVLRVRLRNDAGQPTEVLIEQREVGSTADFTPISIVEPFPGALTDPGKLAAVSTTPTGELHSIGWDALNDFGDSNQRRVLLRFSGELEAPVEVEVLVGNDAPELRDVTFEQLPGEPVVVGVTLVDSASDPVSVQTSFQPGGGTELDPDAYEDATTSGETMELETSAEGMRHEFEWQAGLDLGLVDRPAAIRLVPVDVVDGGSGLEGDEAFDELFLDNNLEPSAEFDPGEVSASGDTRRGVSLPVLVRDREGNPVDLFVQWAGDGDDFPELPEALTTDAVLRAAVLADPAERRALRLATLKPSILRGAVEAVIDDDSVLATWIKREAELRGLVALDFLVGRNAAVDLAEGGSEELRICSYDAGTGLLTFEQPLNVALPPGSVLTIELGVATGLPTSDEGVPHVFVWDTSVDLPGGGETAFRVTPFDRTASMDGSDDCGRVFVTDDTTVVAGGRGAATPGAPAKSTTGPFRVDDAMVVPTAPVDSVVALRRKDLDGDGSTDLVFVAAGSDAIVAKLQTKPGRFDELRLPDANLRSPAGLAVMDFDGNGLVDIAATSMETAKVLLIRQHEGNDFFSDRVVLDAADSLSEPRGLAAADVDGDGGLDLLLLHSPEGGSQLVVFRQGTPTSSGSECLVPEEGYTACLFATPEGSADLGVFTHADLDGDGDVDVAAAGGDSIVVFVGDGAGSFVSSVAVTAAAAEFTAINCVDVNADGSRDLVVINGSQLEVYPQLANGDYDASPLVLASELESDGVTGAERLGSGDFDSNGVVDFLVLQRAAGGSSGSILALFGDDLGLYSGSPLPLAADGIADVQSEPAAGALSIGSIDPRREPGVVASLGSGRSLFLFHAAGSGSFREPAQVLSSEDPVGEAPVALAAADVMADGRVDLLTVSRESGELTIWDQKAIGDFEAKSVAVGGDEASLGPIALASGDIDGDGRGDVVTANIDANNLSILLQDASGGFNQPTEPLAVDGLDGPQSVVVADLDLDGRLDLCTAGRFSNTVHTLLQDDTGAFVPDRELASTIPSGTSLAAPVALLAVDVLDGDGVVEVVSANHDSHNVTIFPTSASIPVAIELGEGVRPIALAAGDVDNDGLVDLVTANTVGPLASLARQESPGAFTVTTLAAAEAGREATGVAVANLTGDAFADVALSLAGDLSSTIRLLLARDSSVAVEPFRLDLEDLDMDAPVGIVAADIDGDCELDVAAPNRQSRNTVIFYGGR